METNIRNIVRQLASGEEQQGIVARVVSIDQEARTVDVEPIDGSAPLLGVNLQANQSASFGLVLWPKQGSYVVCLPTYYGMAAVVVATDEVERLEVKIGERTVLMDADGITLNGGESDGMVKIQELTDKLNELVRTVNALVSAYNAHVHVTTATVGTGPVGVISPTTSQAQAASNFNKSDYENELIKQ